MGGTPVIKRSPISPSVRRKTGLTPELDAFITRMPKVELHVHLEGSIEPQTALELARRNGVGLPARNLVEVQKLYRYRNFSEFLAVFMSLTQVIVRCADFEQLAYEMGLMLARQQVRYAEVMLSPMQHLLRGIHLREAIVGAANGFARAERETGVMVQLALDYGRQYTPAYAWYVLEIAKELRSHRLVAWSIGGDEIHYPPEPFAEVFAAARDAGLHLMAHAGEVAGPSSVWGAVDVLKVSRIGHGIRSVQDPALVAHLRDRGVVLDVCPSSNIRTGAAPSWKQHALRTLYDAGVLVTINSDDPPFFETTLTDEYRRVVHHFGFGVDDLCVLVLNGVRGAFLPAMEKARLLQQIEGELLALRVELGV